MELASGKHMNHENFQLSLNRLRVIDNSNIEGSRFAVAGVVILSGFALCVYLDSKRNCITYYLLSTLWNLRFSRAITLSSLPLVFEVWIALWGEHLGFLQNTSKC